MGVRLYDQDADFPSTRPRPVTVCLDGTAWWACPHKGCGIIGGPCESSAEAHGELAEHRSAEHRRWWR